MPIATKTALRIVSKREAQRIANQRLTLGQIRIASGGGSSRTFLKVLVNTLSDPAITGASIEVVAYPPSHLFDTWMIYTGELVTLGVRDGRSVLIFADDQPVLIEDVLAVTFR